MPVVAGREFTLERDNAESEDDRAGTAKMLTAVEALTEGLGVLGYIAAATVATILAVAWQLTA